MNRPSVIRHTPELNHFHISGRINQTSCEIKRDCSEKSKNPPVTFSQPATGAKLPRRKPVSGEIVDLIWITLHPTNTAGAHHVCGNQLAGRHGVIWPPAPPTCGHQLEHTRLHHAADRVVGSTQQRAVVVLRARRVTGPALHATRPHLGEGGAGWAYRSVTAARPSQPPAPGYRPLHQNSCQYYCSRIVCESFPSDVTHPNQRRQQRISIRPH